MHNDYGLALARRGNNCQLLEAGSCARCGRGRVGGGHKVGHCYHDDLALARRGNNRRGRACGGRAGAGCAAESLRELLKRRDLVAAVSSGPNRRVCLPQLRV